MHAKRINRVRVACAELTACKQETVLIHAAAGGVGLLLVQWAKHLGARVIAIVGNNEKAALVRAQGADLILLSDDDWVTAARNFTQQKRRCRCLRLRGQRYIHVRSIVCGRSA